MPMLNCLLGCRRTSVFSVNCTTTPSVANAAIHYYAYLGQNSLLIKPFTVSSLFSNLFLLKSILPTVHKVITCHSISVNVLCLLQVQEWLFTAFVLLSYVIHYSFWYSFSKFQKQWLHLYFVIHLSYLLHPSLYFQ